MLSAGPAAGQQRTRTMSRAPASAAAPLSGSRPRCPAPRADELTVHAVAGYEVVAVYSLPDLSSPRLGYLRIGQRAMVTPRIDDRGEGCDKGFHALAAGGFACASKGLIVAADKPPYVYLPPPPPRTDSPIPYDYGVITQDGTPMWWRIPDSEEVMLAAQKYKALVAAEQAAAAGQEIKSAKPTRPGPAPGADLPVTPESGAGSGAPPAPAGSEAPPAPDPHSRCPARAGGRTRARWGGLTRRGSGREIVQIRSEHNSPTAARAAHQAPACPGSRVGTGPISSHAAGASRDHGSQQPQHLDPPQRSRRPDHGPRRARAGLSRRSPRRLHAARCGARGGARTPARASTEAARARGARRRSRTAAGARRASSRGSNARRASSLGCDTKASRACLISHGWRMAAVRWSRVPLPASVPLAPWLWRNRGRRSGWWRGANRT